MLNNGTTYTKGYAGLYRYIDPPTLLTNKTPKFPKIAAAPVTDPRDSFGAAKIMLTYHIQNVPCVTNVCPTKNAPPSPAPINIIERYTHPLVTLVNK